jgi:uncharacterized sulfatase
LERILSMAELAASLETEATARLQKGLQDRDSGVRYWAALGLRMRGTNAVAASRDKLEKALRDESASVRIVVAEALGQFGSEADVKRSLDLLVGLADARNNDYWVCLEALNAIDHLTPRAAPAIRQRLRALPNQADVIPKLREYLPRLLERITAQSE